MAGVGFQCVNVKVICARITRTGIAPSVFMCKLFLLLQIAKQSILKRITTLLKMYLTLMQETCLRSKYLSFLPEYCRRKSNSHIFTLIIHLHQNTHSPLLYHTPLKQDFSFNFRTTAGDITQKSRNNFKYSDTLKQNLKTNFKKLN